MYTEEYNTELERMNAQMSAENLALQNDNKQLNALIREYEATYKPRGLVWRVAENFELEPGYHAAARAIRDGKIGAVNSFNARVVGYVAKDSKYYKTPWRTVPDVR